MISTINCIRIRFLTDWGAENKIPHPREDQKIPPRGLRPWGGIFLIFPWVRNFILRPPIREESLNLEVLTEPFFFYDFTGIPI